MHWFARSFFHFGEHRISAEDKVSHQFSDSCEAPRKNSPKETERAINFTLIKHLIFLFICCENFSDFEEREKRKICLSILREKSFILNVSELYGILLCYETIELKKLFIVKTSECARENLDVVWCNKIYMQPRWNQRRINSLEVRNLWRELSLKAAQTHPFTLLAIIKICGKNMLQNLSSFKSLQFHH